MNDIQTLTLWVGAFRYYLGRQTYAVSDFCDLLIQEWNNLPDKCKGIIQRDLEEAFERDDDHRKDQQDLKYESYLPLGMDCDRAEWERVRKLWNETI
jgi:hypothetical protein